MKIPSNLVKFKLYLIFVNILYIKYRRKTPNTMISSYMVLSQIKVDGGKYIRI